MLDEFNFCPYCGASLGKIDSETRFKAYTVESVRRHHRRAYEKWEKAEDETLRKEFADHVEIARIAELHGRKQGAIHSRLQKLGVLPSKATEESNH